ncbi:Golgin subfamily A member 7/ERF4 family-domain-containing protein [Phlebopus sp. FC_14]|nr:Golgin subfamily A member 7/ERF4 family-domain-containing protein [Phlebopus sp. FC_14]
MEFRPPSRQQQSWDAADPESHDQVASDYYSTLKSKNFSTLQKTRRRPLVPHSSYYFGPPPPDAAYGTPPVGQIGVHHPREIVRIERDYGGGELVQFSPIYPLELEGRITPTQFHETINDINEILISAHGLGHSFFYNFLAIVTLQLSTLVMTSHYTKEMRRLERKIDELNTQLYNPVGLNILWPWNVAFLFLEIEYY